MKISPKNVFSLLDIKKNWVLFWIGFLTFILYLSISFLYFQPDTFWSPDEGAKFFQMQAIKISKNIMSFDIPYQGHLIDPEYKFALSEHPLDLLILRDQNRITFERLPTFTAATKPLFSLFGFTGLYVLPALTGALIPVLFLLLIPHEKRNWLMWGLISFASPIWIYSTIFWEHTIAVLLNLIALVILLTVNNKKHKPFRLAIYYLVATFLFGLSFFIRLETLLISIPFITVCFVKQKQRRPWIIFIAVYLIIVAFFYFRLHGFFFQGNNLPVNARYLFRPFDYIRSAGWNAIPALLIGPEVDEAINTNWLGGLWTIGAIIAIAHSLAQKQSQTTRNLQYIGLAFCLIASAWFLFNPNLYRSAHGLLFTTPWAIIGFTNMRRVWDQHKEKTNILILTVSLGIILYSINMLFLRGSSPHGGLEWGARFAMSFYPLLAIIAAWDWLKQHAINIILTIFLALIGFGFQIRGMITIHNDRQINSDINKEIQIIPENHIASDLWWFLLNSAPLEPKKSIYSLQGFNEIPEWINLLQENEIRQFALVTLDRNLPWHLRSIHPELDTEVQEIIRVGDIWLFRLEINQ
jgi:hypothetical protein